jgi:hypothetical protein
MFLSGEKRKAWLRLRDDIAEHLTRAQGCIETSRVALSADPAAAGAIALTLAAALADIAYTLHAAEAFNSGLALDVDQLKAVLMTDQSSRH